MHSPTVTLSRITFRLADGIGILKSGSSCIRRNDALRVRLIRCHASTIPPHHPPSNHLQPSSSSVHSLLKADAFNSESLLLNLQRAADKQDLRSTWLAYDALSANGLLHAVSPLNITLINKTVAANAHTKTDDEALRTLALFCAHRGVADGLRAVMVECIARSDNEAVVRLYNELNNAPLEDGKLKSLEPDEFVDIDELSNVPKMADFLILAVAARAADDRFHDALHIVLSSPHIRVSSVRLNKLCGELKLSEDMKGRLAKYHSALEMASLVHRPESFRAHARNLSEPRSERGLEKLCVQLIAGFDGELPWASSGANQLSHSRPVLVSDMIWASLLRSLLYCRMDELAGRLWAKMVELHIPITVSVWNALLEGYRETGRLGKVIGTWNAMVQSSVAPNVTSHCARIISLFESRINDQASAAFDECKRDPNIEKAEMTIVFNCVLQGLLHQNDLAGALQLFNTMSSEGPAPDIVSFNTFLQYYAKKQDMRSVSFVFRSLSQAGVQPDVVTFTTIYTALLRTGKREATDQLHEVMREMGIEPNVATYSAMVDQYVKEGTREGIRLGRDLLEKMEGIPGSRPNDITYTSFLMGVQRCHELTHEEVGQIQDDIIERMEKRGIRIKRGVYHTLLKGALENPRPSGIRTFKKYYRAMVKKNVGFAHDTWYIILSGLIRRNEWKLAKEMVDNMMKSEFQPMWGVQEMARTILIRFNSGRDVGSR